MTQLRTVHCVVNPVAGSGGCARLAGRMIRALQRGGVRVARTFTRPGETADLVRHSVDPATDAVVVAGGDGTVRDVIDGLAPRRVPILVLSMGTENLVAKELGLRADLETAMAVLRAGHCRPMDVAVVNGLHFLVVSGIGFDATVVERLMPTRRSHITRADYFWPVWRTFWSYRFPAIEVEVDGERVFAGRGLAFVGNCHRYSIGLRILERARFDDGLLDVCVYPCTGPVSLLRQSWRTLMRRHTRARDVVYRQGRQIRITSAEAVPVEADGDPAGTLPACYSILPSAATMLVPPPAVLEPSG